MDCVDDAPPVDPEPVTLRAITAANRPAVERLRVAASQEGFVDGASRSIAEAAATPQAKPWYRAIYVGAAPVGFVMLSDGVAPGDPAWPWPYYLWRLLIDECYQGRGYGWAALDLVVAHLRKRPDADDLMTSVVPGEGSPLGFYLRYGFVATGENFGPEQVLRLRLRCS